MTKFWHFGSGQLITIWCPKGLTSCCMAVKLKKRIQSIWQVRAENVWSTEFLQIKSCSEYNLVSTSRLFQTPSHPFGINDPINLHCHNVSMTQSFRLKTSYSVMLTWFCSKQQAIDSTAMSNTKIKQVKSEKEVKSHHRKCFLYRHHTVDLMPDGNLELDDRLW